MKNQFYLHRDKILILKVLNKQTIIDSYKLKHNHCEISIIIVSNCLNYQLTIEKMSLQTPKKMYK